MVFQWALEDLQASNYLAVNTEREGVVEYNLAVVDIQVELLVALVHTLLAHLHMLRELEEVCNLVEECTWAEVEAVLFADYMVVEHKKGLVAQAGNREVERREMPLVVQVVGKVAAHMEMLLEGQVEGKVAGHMRESLWRQIQGEPLVHHSVFHSRKGYRMGHMLGCKV